MAGSYQHIVNENGTFCGVSHLDHMGDAYEALEECYWMIQRLAGGSKERIEAARSGADEKADVAEEAPIVYWAILWREKDDWGWLTSLNGDLECTTQNPARRRRYESKAGAMAALWKFRADNPRRTDERLCLVRVRVRRPQKAKG